MKVKNKIFSKIEIEKLAKLAKQASPNHKGKSNSVPVVPISYVR
jgi:hypothetical protein